MTFTGTYTIELEGKTVTPSGTGQRVMTVKCVMSPMFQAIHAGDIGLRRIVSIAPVDVKSGSMFFFSVSPDPGSYQNYASVTFWRIALRVGGTIGRDTITDGSKTFWIRATGD